jgi:hypothetical protein
MKDSFRVITRQGIVLVFVKPAVDSVVDYRDYELSTIDGKPSPYKVFSSKGVLAGKKVEPNKRYSPTAGYLAKKNAFWSDEVNATLKSLK